MADNDKTATTPVATLHTYWRIDPDVRATFAIMPDGRVLRRFDGPGLYDGAAPWTLEGVQVEATAAGLRRWVDQQDYEAVGQQAEAAAPDTVAMDRIARALKGWDKDSGDWGDIVVEIIGIVRGTNRAVEDHPREEPE